MSGMTIPGVNGKEIKIPVHGEYYYDAKGEEFMWIQEIQHVDHNGHTCRISTWKNTGRNATTKNQRSLIQLK